MADIKFTGLAPDAAPTGDDIVAIVDITSGNSKKATLSAIALALQSTITPAGTLNPFAGISVPSGWLSCDGSAVSRTTYATLFTAISTSFGTGDGSTTFNLPDMRGRLALGAGTGTFTETFTAASVTVASDIITVSTAAGKQFINGTPVVLSTSGGAPAGLVAGTTYYVIAQSATSIKLAANLANAVAGTPIDITSQGTGNHTLTLTLTARTLADRGGEESHALTTNELASHLHAQDPQDIRYVGSGGQFTIPGGAVENTGAHNTSPTGGSVAHNLMQPFVAINYIIKT